MTDVAALRIRARTGLTNRINREAARSLAKPHASPRDELRLASRQGMLMYFETDYFGGLGCQGAAVFQHGELIFGPQSAKTGAINQGLKLLGIRIKPPRRKTSSKQSGLTVIAIQRDGLNVRNIGSINPGSHPRSVVGTRLVGTFW
jgi:hypothetical protein